MKYYDTCALINQSAEIFASDEKFYVSTITIKELENIKTSNAKDQDTKFKTRKLLREMGKNREKYTYDIYKYGMDFTLFPFLADNNDSRIIYSALQMAQVDSDLIFVTDDLSCAILADAAGLKVEYSALDDDNYTGYIYVKCNSSDELADLYNNKIYNSTASPFNLLLNQYLLVQDSEGNIIDKYKQTEDGLKRIEYIKFNSKMFGETKPRDAYQLIAMDALAHQKIVKLGGPAGTGKSYLAMSYLFDLYEHGKIDRIIIFCNTVATAGAAKLGFYPGSRDEKLLDSQIGNFLMTKLGGDRDAVYDLVDHGTIMLMPFSDIRGIDTSGLNAGVYVTEAQNTDVDLMKLALQRIGEDSICILDGDEDAQVDMGQYAGRNNGLRRVSQVFRGEDVYAEVKMPNIYRSKIARIAQKM